ncbi:hypothetical protein Ga0080559_TMP3887 [Salipiger profundus]|uniref:Uncharacterized protein n=1 Tax=Salipiger profundus TaxID=1229727 RepID=A0A1U7D976_9RHOB|nr:hypothetical protein Ga0080559_TMP3887 [Salipiger profundus]
MPISTSLTPAPLPCPGHTETPAWDNSRAGVQIPGRRRKRRPEPRPQAEPLPA